MNTCSQIHSSIAGCCWKLGALLLTVLCVSCGGSSDTANAATPDIDPQINSLAPNSGPVDILDPKQAALTPTLSAAAVTYPQQTISAFAPKSGPVGTVVTVTGTDFTGSNAAWVGSAHNAILTVLSDTKVTVKVPAGATTGAIGILNPQHAAFTPTAYTVAVTYPQQTISAFAPKSGPVGTVVTVTGTGFTGSNAAWVGSAHNAILTVLSDTKVTVKVPAGATTGAIGILNPQHAAFTPTAYTVTVPFPQQTISAFTPKSGPVGTVVTVTGTGFTGSNAAWVGSAHNAVLTVLSDTQATVKVPTGATTGAVRILNPQHSADSATAFTVTVAYPQQTISAFTPKSGPVGTVVTVTGTGFIGSNAAWVGSAHNAVLTVLSDTQATVKVPAGATTGAIGILNPQYAVFTPTSYTVTGSAGALSMRVQGNKFIDASGQIIQPRGVNYSGFEFAAIQGWSPTDPSGGQAGQFGGPNWDALKSWHANIVRFPLNEASWLGYTCTDTDGVARNPDPGGNYRSAVATQVAQANAAGLYVILVLHWAAPGNACPMLQTQMANADNSLDFWISIANQFKNNPSVMFSLYNEPFFNFDFSGGDPWDQMMFGTEGTLTGYPATSNSGNWQNLQQPWTVASYQALINAVRSTGATNVVLVGTLEYSQDFSFWLAHKPTDPMNQMAAVWHAYPTYGAPFGSFEHSQPNFAPDVFADAQQILDANIPVIITESGDQNSPGTVGAPHSSTMTQFADQTGVGIVFWTWDVWGDANNVLIKDVSGTPTDGYGVFVKSWMVNHLP